MHATWLIYVYISSRGYMTNSTSNTLNCVCISDIELKKHYLIDIITWITLIRSLVKELSEECSTQLSK